MTTYVNIQHYTFKTLNRRKLIITSAHTLKHKQIRERLNIKRLQYCLFHDTLVAKIDQNNKWLSSNFLTRVNFVWLI